VCHDAECRNLFIVMLIVFILSVVMLSVAMLSLVAVILLKIAAPKYLRHISELNVQKVHKEPVYAQHLKSQGPNLQKCTTSNYCSTGMGRIEIFPLSAPLKLSAAEHFFLCSVQILNRSWLIFSVQVENGQDYWRKMTLNKAN
jgi:hypothetical protein